MNHDAEKMIAALSPAIDRKCTEIKTARKELLYLRLFVLLCVMAVVVPTAFVLFGISLISLLIPAVLTAAAVLGLSPILISQQGGRNREQI